MNYLNEESLNEMCRKGRKERKIEDLSNNMKTLLQLCRVQGDEIKKLNRELVALKSVVELAVIEVEKTRDTMIFHDARKDFEERCN